MRVQNIIMKKRQGKALSAEDIDFVVQKYTRDDIPDYQIAALLMAIVLRGMTYQETANLTRSMLKSGEHIDFSGLYGPKIDKHSTGGVGDKISLILAPLMAAAGLYVPMMSGRALAHSGGTLDKLEAIPGFRTNLSVAELVDQVKKLGIAMFGQTEKIAPADKKMYALRDATATIESVPLITASILSKKLAEGIDGLVMDVKAGSGAFMQTLEQAEELADNIIHTAELNDLPTVALITNMNQPLGYAVGNWLETREAIQCLRNEGPKDLMDLTFALGTEMFFLGKRAENEIDARSQLEKHISNGSAFEKFKQMVADQGGDIRFIESPEDYPASKFEQPIFAEQSGIIHQLDARTIGIVVMKLGGGRAVMSDTIDPKAGIILTKKIGDAVQKGELLATMYTDREKKIRHVAGQVKEAIVINKEPVQRQPLIFKKRTRQNDNL